MSLILSLTVASALGTFVGNTFLLWVVGRVAMAKEKQQAEELRKLQMGYLQMVQRERERIERYAQMES